MRMSSMSTPTPEAPLRAMAPGRDGATQGTSALHTPCLQSNALLQGHSSVSIQHNGSIYRLQATKLGKLILTK